MSWRLYTHDLHGSYTSFMVLGDASVSAMINRRSQHFASVLSISLRNSVHLKYLTGVSCLLIGQAKGKDRDLTITFFVSQTCIIPTSSWSQHQNRTAAARSTLARETLWPSNSLMFDMPYLVHQIINILSVLLLWNVNWCRDKELDGSEASQPSSQRTWSSLVVPATVPTPKLVHHEEYP